MKIILSRADLYAHSANIPMNELDTIHFFNLTRDMLMRSHTVVFVDNDGSIRYFKNRDIVNTRELAKDIRFVVDKIHQHISLG